jgi:hypothetical protein
MCKVTRPEGSDPRDPQFHDLANVGKSTPISGGDDSMSKGAGDLKVLAADAERGFLQCLGIQDRDFWVGFAKQLVIVNSDGKRNDEIDTNFDLAFVRGAKPGDQVAAASAMQLSIVHRLAVICARRFLTASSHQELEIHQRMFTALVRTYSGGMQAFKSYNSNDPSVTVQNVSVRDGGQAAIIGKVTRG